MAPDLGDLPILFGLTGSAIALCSTATFTSYPLVKQLVVSIWRRREGWDQDEPELFEDADGVATEASQEACSPLIPKIVIFIGSFAGFIFSLTLAINDTVHKRNSELVVGWLYTATWLLLFIRAMCIAGERSYLRTFRASADLAILSSLALIATSAEVFYCLNPPYLHRHGKHHSHDPIFITGMLVAAVVTTSGAVSMPRKPILYYNGMRVDEMQSASMISRYSFGWAGRLLKLARTKGSLDVEDLPHLDAKRRAKTLRDAYSSMKKSPKLWIDLWRYYFWYIAFQWLMTFFSSVLTFSPQFFMYKIIEVLEARRNDAESNGKAYLYVGCLFIFKFAQVSIQSYIFWMAYYSIMIPIRTQLSAIIFGKTMRKKDVKSTKKKGSQTNSSDGSNGQVNGEVNGDAIITAAKKAEVKLDPVADEEDNELKGLRQGVINLIGVDSNRIAEFVAYNNIYGETIFTLAAGLGFLIYLIGFIPLLAGLSTTVIITPINWWVSKEYAAAQERLMKARDRKLAVVSEALHGIRQIKFSALESQWQERIMKVRTEELAEQRSVYLWDTALISLWISGPTILSVVALSAYALIHGDIVPSVAFTALAIFNDLEFVLTIVPELTTNLLDAKVSISRIQEYVSSPEKANDIVVSSNIALRDATIAWAADDQNDPDRFTLRDINIEFPRSELSVISGQTGSGKSLLLSALLGEADILKGSIEMPECPDASERFDARANAANWILPGAVAFVAQIPWIENATIKDNILFGLPLDSTRYRKTLRACALEKDLDMLTDGELTEIGANGINLSGGQRWRVSLARAVYSRAGIVIMDDIFSAVDAHVGKQIFEECLIGELMADRTRILVTHHVQLVMDRAAYAVSLGKGVVEHAGTISELKKSGSIENIVADEEEALELHRTRTSASQRLIDGGGANVGPKPPPRKFVEDEMREKGSVRKAVYRKYVDSTGGIPFWAFIAATFILTEGLILSRGWWVKIWTGSYSVESAAGFFQVYTSSISNAAAKLQTIAAEQHDLVYWIGIYLTISLVMCAVGTFRYWWVFSGALRASRSLFEEMTATILRTPLRWLDTVPIGRVVNRFSKDFETVDSRVGYDLSFLLYNSLAAVGAIVAGVIVHPLMLLFALVLISIAVYYARAFIPAAREAKRLESNAKSPIFELFGSSLAGVGSIRAFGKGEEYVVKMYSKLDELARCTYYIWLFNRWLGFRMHLVGSFFSLLVSIIVVSVPDIDPSLAGFALTFALEYSLTIVWTVRRYSNVELDMNAAERIIEYVLLKTEDQGGQQPPAAWPTDGRLEIENLVVGYAPDLPPVLKGLSFEIKPRERVGVVGRTGAGKSSLTLSIFRFLEAREGCVRIDGLDTSKITLHDLRSRMGIIPQDPVLFSGTVRSNLDPFDQHEDHELRDALERVHLIASATTSRADTVESTTSTASAEDTNKNVFEDLSSSISEGGLNLSQGQRQLLCLARAIVSRPKILTLDEATSSVDMSTDALIQKSIREEFTDCTLLVIAHRLSTVIDYDRILVLSDGQAIEFAEPWRLLQAKGAFYEMVQQSGEADALMEQGMKAKPSGSS